MIPDSFSVAVSDVGRLSKTLRNILSATGTESRLSLGRSSSTASSIPIARDRTAPHRNSFMSRTRKAVSSGEFSSRARTGRRVAQVSDTVGELAEIAEGAEATTDAPNSEGPTAR